MSLGGMPDRVHCDRLGAHDCWHLAATTASRPSAAGFRASAATAPSAALLDPLWGSLPPPAAAAPHAQPRTDPLLLLPALQSYIRDTFLFLFVILTAVAGGYSLKQHRCLLLHRSQTEEWKGWMQVRGGALRAAHQRRQRAS